MTKECCKATAEEIFSTYDTISRLQREPMGAVITHKNEVGRIEKLQQFIKYRDELRKKYLKRIGLRCSIKEEHNTKDCVFLTGSNGEKGCAIYNFRPMQCRTWPFWQSILTSEYDWNATATRCPGINKGRLYTFEEIQKLKKQKKWRGH